MQQREVTRSLGHLLHNFPCPENLPAFVPNAPFAPNMCHHYVAQQYVAVLGSHLDRDGPLCFHARVMACVR